MKLKDKIISSHKAFENQYNFGTDIQEIRKEALKQFEVLGFPTQKLEEWKYTSLDTVINQDYNLVSKSKNTIDASTIENCFVDELDSYKIVFVDGFYNENLSDIDQNLADINVMSDALLDSKSKQIIDSFFNKIAKQDNLTSLNTAFVNEGAYIYVPKSVQVDKPIQIVYLYTNEQDNALLQARNLVVVEKNAHVKIIESHQNLSNSEVFTNIVTEISCDTHGTVDYYKIQNDTIKSSLVDNTYIDQKSDSEVSVHTFSFGGKITRNNLNFYQNGEHINSILKGVTIIEQEEHVDHFTLVHHIEPNCESHQDYKGIYNDNSVGVFNGKVFVEKEAQKTDAYQQNDNVLLSDNATINAKPQLEIYADDVKCSHGCTIGQLDEEALFYMQQRGISKTQANGLLMFAFANSVLESVKISELRSYVTKIIANKLKVDIDF